MWKGNILMSKKKQIVYPRIPYQESIQFKNCLFELYHLVRRYDYGSVKAETKKIPDDYRATASKFSNLLFTSRTF